MTDEDIKALFAKLHSQLENADQIDTDTAALAKAVEADIHKLINAHPDAENSENIVDRAKALEAEFAAKHPASEGFIREIIELLGRMGI